MKPGPAPPAREAGSSAFRAPVSYQNLLRKIRDVTVDPEDAAVVKAIIYLGRSFGMEVIAEGVETQEQYDFLKQEKCGEVQGYLFGKPVRVAEFEASFLKP
jgi:EAL domain-containing protein (putative c-di-GMP-specific phosphodiesterase class I)